MMKRYLSATLCLLVTASALSFAQDSVPAGPIAIERVGQEATDAPAETETTAKKSEFKQPVVPLSVIRKDVPKYEKPEPEKKEMVRVQPSRQYTAPDGTTRIPIRPGVNEIVQVALGHLNRIVTPFNAPRIHLSDKNVTREIRGSVIYVGPNTDRTVTLYITEDGQEDTALSLSLVPKEMPPREITLEIEGDPHMTGRNFVNRPAERWEQSDQYMRTIVKALELAALQEVPPGYQLQQGAQLKTFCEQAGLKFYFKEGQLLRGGNLEIEVGVVENISDRMLEFVEQSCADWEVAAVAAFPHVRLAPGQRAEVYVVRRIRTIERIKVRRTSLLDKVEVKDGE